MKTKAVTSADETQLIVKCLKELPSKALFAQAKTKDQRANWLCHHVLAFCTAQCLDALHKGKNDPIRPLRESEQISIYFYNRIWLTTKFLNAWWELAQISFVFVQPELKRQGFSHICGSAFEIFSWFAQHMIDDDFSTCLAKYCEISSRKTVKEYRRAKKLFKEEGTPVQQRTAPKNGSKDEYESVLLIILFTCYANATRDEPVLKASLETLMAAGINLGDYVTKHCWHTPSHAWKDGKLGKGDKDGIYKFS